jgi:hypothetical protein
MSRPITWATTFAESNLAKLRMADDFSKDVIFIPTAKVLLLLQKHKYFQENSQKNVNIFVQLKKKQ